MLLASSVSCLFKWRQFEPEVILLAVDWYLRFSLSYRDVEELLAERGLHADHVTVEPRKVFQLLFVFLSPSGFLNTLVAKKSFFDLD